ncbi:MAG: hypothetical protein ABIV63_16560, partial [Caldimonas sp.]
AYGTDVRALLPRLIEVMRKVPRVVDDPGPNVLLNAFAADGMELTLQFWIRDSENGQGNVKSEINLAVLDVLNASGIEIPYPQRVVHALVSMERGVDADLQGRVTTAGGTGGGARPATPDRTGAGRTPGVATVG